MQTINKTLFGMVPNGTGWAKGEHYVWAERSLRLPRRWVYWHTTIKADIGKSGWCSETSTMAESYTTKKEALAAGVQHISRCYFAELVTP